MASHQEKVSYTTTNSVIQNSSRSGEQEGFIEQQQIHEKCSKSKVVEEFDSVMVKDVLAPLPVSCIPLGSGLRVEEEVEGSSVKHTNVGTEIGQHQPALTITKNKEKKHTTAGTDGEFYFELFKFKDGSEQYILNMHRVQSDDVQSYHVMLENNGSKKWNVRVYEIQKIEHMVYLMEEDPSPPIFPKKYILPLLERLSGWTLEKRKRNKGKEDNLEKRKHGNNIKDKFYYHQSRQFRSLVEVTSFLLYSCKPKDLKPKTTIMKVPELREEEATAEMKMLSLVEASDTINACLFDANSEEKAPQNIVEKPTKSSCSSNAPINESNETQNLEWSMNEDQAEKDVQFINSVIDFWHDPVL